MNGRKTSGTRGVKRPQRTALDRSAEADVSVGLGGQERMFAHLETAGTIPAGGGFRGKAVHIAARVGAVTEANEILASRETADAARVTFTNPRIVELKGISEPVEIVCVDWT